MLFDLVKQIWMLIDIYRNPFVSCFRIWHLQAYFAMLRQIFISIDALKQSKEFIRRYRVLEGWQSIGWISNLYLILAMIIGLKFLNTHIFIQSFIFCCRFIGSCRSRIWQFIYNPIYIFQ